MTNEGRLCQPNYRHPGCHTISTQNKGFMARNEQGEGFSRALFMFRLSFAINFSMRALLKWPRLSIMLSV